ncbi:MAG TPA: di-heme oxidoredictase family protein [Thermoanaerobaculia bacterium]|nr:di-heme oxidoredictase family protein [Thermoanaerobaculia bacterium]
MNKAKRWVRRLASPDGLVLLVLVMSAPVVYAITATEAPAGFDNLTNGFLTQTQFNIDLATFDGREDIADGLGPVYNAQACAECHQNPVSGATSQITELRAGALDPFSGAFTNPPGGSLINDRAINAAIQERLSTTQNLVDTRSSLNILGDGFVEAIADATFTSIQTAQPSGRKGTIIRVPVLEAPGTTRIARFGWKNQQASLLSFAADAYLNEMGITSPLQPTENTSMGASVAAFDTVPDPEEAATGTAPFGPDVEAFARFMRSTKVPPRDTALAATADAVAGANLFTSIGCASCHTATITTAPAGTVINGNKFTVPAALGDKIIHPYSDFMLHDVGTGDGIIQNGGAVSQFKMRTPPLWGLRTRARFMHDLFNTTRTNAIQRHTNEAEPVIQNYLNLSVTQQNQIGTFLNSL